MRPPIWTTPTTRARSSLGHVYLSAISAQTSAMVRDHAARRWASVEHEQARAVSKAIERVMAASGIFVERYAKALDLAKGPSAEATRAIGRLADG